MRLAAAIGVIAVTLAAAVYVHERKVLRQGCSVESIASFCFVRPSWEDPVAVLLALGGIAVATGIGASGNSKSRG